MELRTCLDLAGVCLQAARRGHRDRHLGQPRRDPMCVWEGAAGLQRHRNCASSDLRWSCAKSARAARGCEPDAEAPGLKQTTLKRVPTSCCSEDRFSPDTQAGKEAAPRGRGGEDWQARPARGLRKPSHRRPARTAQFGTCGAASRPVSAGPTRGTVSAELSNQNPTC